MTDMNTLMIKNYIHEFRSLKKMIKKHIKDIVKETNNHNIKEAALPAYAHDNFFIDYIFWKRLEITYNLILEKGYQRILDFGCGTGIVSFLLAKKGLEVIAVDTEFEALNKMRKKMDFPRTIQFFNADLSEISIEKKSIDAIVALDVLEHIDDLSVYMKLFCKILKKDGSVIVSGPTENGFYKIGRKIAGADFTGGYHVSNIYKIKDQFRQQFELESTKKIFWPITLFEIFVAKPKPSYKN